MIIGGVNSKITGKGPLLSSSELEYIRLGVGCGLRNDGRSLFDWRTVNYTKDAVAQAAGSARLAVGGTEVLVSIKGDLGRPTLERPEQGIINLMVDTSTVFAADLPGAASLEDRSVQERNGELCMLLTDILLGDGAYVDVGKLLIEAGAHCWILHVDVLILHSDGNLVDVSTMATRLALASLVLPAVQVVSGGECSELVLLEPKANEPQLPVFDIGSIPLAVTLARVGAGLNSIAIVDPSAAEENCVEDALVVALVMGQKTPPRVAMLRKLGGGGLLDPAMIPAYIQMAVDAASVFLSRLDQS